MNPLVAVQNIRNGEEKNREHKREKFPISACCSGPCILKDLEELERFRKWQQACQNYWTTSLEGRIKQTGILQTEKEKPEGCRPASDMTECIMIDHSQLHPLQDQKSMKQR